MVGRDQVEYAGIAQRPDAVGDVVPGTLQRDGASTPGSRSPTTGGSCSTRRVVLPAPVMIPVLLVAVGIGDSNR
ncbi:hypothetical protein OG792_19845 [Micromonospora sp. NBC_01699]|uniref:hypothetical protein n=1 Tax=Micromonospora sp. NBC_01699 TaxID=2975984 RepID=UPI002E2D1702|nr:hypothetical protein [Micromonospora sp. NBC_01699]